MSNKKNDYSISSAMDAIRNKEEKVKKSSESSAMTDDMAQTAKDENAMSAVFNVRIDELLHYAATYISDAQNEKTFSVKLNGYNANIVGLIKRQLKISPNKLVNFLLYNLVKSNINYFKELNKKCKFEV